MFSVGKKLIKQLFGQRPTKAKAQVTLEFTLCFIVVVILFLACFRALIWAGNMFVGRQNAYENSRTDGRVDFYQPSNISLITTINRD